MRIADPNSTANALAPETAVPQPAAHPHEGSTAGTIAPGSDRAELSSFADRVAGLLQSDSANRAERIAQLKAAFAGGTYQVDSAAVSRALVNTALSAPADALLK
jgi:flagellar biosynthesis anti-sigma factor FlgM